MNIDPTGAGLANLGFFAIAFAGGLLGLRQPQAAGASGVEDSIGGEQDLVPNRDDRFGVSASSADARYRSRR